MKPPRKPPVVVFLKRVKLPPPSPDDPFVRGMQLVAKALAEEKKRNRVTKPCTTEAPTPVPEEKPKRVRPTGLKYKKREHVPKAATQPGNHDETGKGIGSDNPVSLMRQYYGNRVTIKNGLWLLDGKPLGLDGCMREYNAYLKEYGLAQVGRKPSWLIEED